MKLIDSKVSEYLDILKSGAPAPGGGAASALAGAQGMALVIMVCGLTIGRDKFSEFQGACAEAKEKAEGLLKALLKAVDDDSDAYDLVFNSYKLPKDAEEEKLKRSAAIQDGMIKATEVPLSVMNSAYEGLKIISGLKGKTNPTAESDIAVGAMNLIACVRGAWLNVESNLPGLKDAEKVRTYHETGLKIMEGAEALATELKAR